MLERHQWRLLPRLEPLLQRRQRLAHVLRHVLVVTHDHHNAVGLLVCVERGERFEADASVRAALWDKQKRPELLRKETQDTRRRGAVLQQGGWVGGAFPPNAVGLGLLPHGLKPRSAVSARLLEIDVRHALGAQLIEDLRRVARAPGH